MEVVERDNPRWGGNLNSRSVLIDSGDFLSGEIKMDGLGVGSVGRILRQLILFFSSGLVGTNE